MHIKDEIAAQIRTGENLDLAWDTVQNRLDNIQGQIMRFRNWFWLLLVIYLLVRLGLLSLQVIPGFDLSGNVNEGDQLEKILGVEQVEDLFLLIAPALFAGIYLRLEISLIGRSIMRTFQRELALKLFPEMAKDELHFAFMPLSPGQILKILGRKKKGEKLSLIAKLRNGTRHLEEWSQLVVSVLTLVSLLIFPVKHSPVWLLIAVIFFTFGLIAYTFKLIHDYRPCKLLGGKKKKKKPEKHPEDKS